MLQTSIVPLGRAEIPTANNRTRMSTSSTAHDLQTLQYDLNLLLFQFRNLKGGRIKMILWQI